MSAPLSQHSSRYKNLRQIKTNQDRAITVETYFCNIGYTNIHPQIFTRLLMGSCHTMATSRTTINEAANTNLEPAKQSLASKKAIATAKASQNTASSQSPSAQSLNAQSSNAQSLEDSWVTLHNPPSDYSHHEALLLCEIISGEWVSWVPGYGEITLTLDQFH